MLKIPLASLQDVLNVADEAHFEQLVTELPEILRSMRTRAKIDGHAGFNWPINWRVAGGPSMITFHFSDGKVLKHPLDAVDAGSAGAARNDR